MNRSIKTIQEDLAYNRVRYRDAIREGKDEDAEVFARDIEELEEELADKEMGL